MNKKSYGIMGEPIPHLNTGPVDSDASYMPKEAMWDAPYHDEPVEVDGRAMSEGDTEYQALIEASTPPEDFLDSEQCAELSQTVQLGLAAAQEVVRTPVSSPEFDELMSEVAAGKAARDELVLGHLRLAAWFVRKTMDFDKERRMKGTMGRVKGRIVGYLDNLKYRNLNYDERMQVATLSLLECAQTPIPEGRTFRSLAAYQMESDAIRYVESIELPVTIPANALQNYKRIQTVKREMKKEGIDNPTDLQIAARTNIDVDSVPRYDGLGATLMQHISLDQLRDVVEQAGNRDDIFGEDTERLTLSDILVEQYSGRESLPSPEVAAMSELRDVTLELLLDLNEFERAVMALRFGFTDGFPLTQSEIANRFGVSNSYIGQVEAKVLAKLRNMVQIKNYKPEYSYKNRPAHRVQQLFEQSEDISFSLPSWLKLSDDENTMLGLTTDRM